MHKFSSNGASVRVKPFQIVPYPAHKTAPQLTVHHTVIIAVGKEHHVPDGDHVPLFRFDHCRLLADRPQGQNAYLWLVNDGGPKDISKRAHIGYRVGPPLISSGFKAPVLAR